MMFANERMPSSDLGLKSDRIRAPIAGRKMIALSRKTGSGVMGV
jgi:hypothetical protein